MPKYNKYEFIPLDHEPQYARLTQAYAALDAATEAARLASGEARDASNQLNNTLQSPRRDGETVAELMHSAHLAALKEQALKGPLMVAIADLRLALDELPKAIFKPSRWTVWQRDATRVDEIAAVRLLKNALSICHNIKPFNRERVGLSLDADYNEAFGTLLALPLFPKPEAETNVFDCNLDEWRLLLECLAAAMSPAGNPDGSRQITVPVCSSTLEKVMARLTKAYWEVAAAPAAEQPGYTTISFTPRRNLSN